MATTVPACVEIKFTLRSLRRLLDGVAVSVPHRSTEPALVDFHTDTTDVKAATLEIYAQLYQALVPRFQQSGLRGMLVRLERQKRRTLPALGKMCVAASMPRGAFALRESRRRLELDVVAAMASTRCHTAVTPSMRPHESLRVS